MLHRISKEVKVWGYWYPPMNVSGGKRRENQQIQSGTPSLKIFEIPHLLFRFSERNQVTEISN